VGGQPWAASLGVAGGSGTDLWASQETGEGGGD
jgi:hypothetical protein